MDALTVGSVVAALVTGAASTAGADLMMDANTALGRLVCALRRRFATDHPDPDASSALEKALEVPDSPSRRQSLAEAIERHARDRNFGEDLQRLVEQAQTEGVDVVAAIQNAWGNNNVQVAGVSLSSIKITVGPTHG